MCVSVPERERERERGRERARACQRIREEGKEEGGMGRKTEGARETVYGGEKLKISFKNDLF